MRLPLEIENAILGAGAYRVRAVEATPPSSACSRQYEMWIERGCNASMEYLVRHANIRNDLNMVLPGVQTVICCAFNFYPGNPDDFKRKGVAMYAYGKDYHKVLRSKLAGVAEMLEKMGGKARICVDSAPVAERYYASVSGLGFRGRNGAIIIPGAGSCFFLVEILTTLRMQLFPSSQLPDMCLDCGKCIEACPGNAISADGTLDCRKCASYLTIEHKGEFTPLQEDVLNRASRPIFGCDLCLKVCPHNNNHPATKIEEFFPLKALDMLNENVLEEMSDKQFEEHFKASPLKRAGRENLLRNLRIKG